MITTGSERISRFLKRAAVGEELVVAFFGGSINGMAAFRQKC